MEVVDIIRRLLLTCMPIAFTSSARVIVYSSVVAFMALVIQYEFRPYKLDAMNTVKVMEAWQNVLFIVVLLIQDARMFERDGMYELAGWDGSCCMKHCIDTMSSEGMSVGRGHPRERRRF